MSSRVIEPKMVAFIDDRLKNNGLAQHAILEKDARLLMTEAAKACVGIREKTGNNDGPMVELIQETIGGHSHEAWCLAFVQTCIAYAELKTGQKSPLVATEHCMTCFRDTPKDQRVKFNPLPGAVVIWKHGSSDNGHTGIVLGCDEDTFTAVEGNTTSGTNPNGQVVREGGGVYFTRRNRDGNGDMRVQGFLKPF
jgi:hypothetical protein